jgi:hypothetical protein
MASAVFSNWKGMDVVTGYSYGSLFSGFVGVDDKNFKLEKTIQIVRSFYNLSCFYYAPANHFWRPLGIVALGGAAVKSVTLLNKELGKTIENYTGNILTITTLALVVLNRKNNPTCAIVATITATIELLNVYKKLPEPIAKAWTFAPAVSSGITLYATDDIMQRVKAVIGLAEFAFEKFAPAQDKGCQQ